uniref:ATP synthase F0 subunit 8 n=1 Tax=Panagrolaimus sp. JU765 TaxID=591449 RepID=A0AC34QLG4_9BILA
MENYVEICWNYIIYGIFFVVTSFGILFCGKQTRKTGRIIDDSGRRRRIDEAIEAARLKAIGNEKIDESQIAPLSIKKEREAKMMCKEKYSGTNERPRKINERSSSTKKKKSKSRSRSSSRERKRKGSKSKSKRSSGLFESPSKRARRASQAARKSSREKILDVDVTQEDTEGKRSPRNGHLSNNNNNKSFQFDGFPFSSLKTAEERPIDNKSVQTSIPLTAQNMVSNTKANDDYFMIPKKNLSKDAIHAIQILEDITQRSVSERSDKRVTVSKLHGVDNLMNPTRSMKEDVTQKSMLTPSEMATGREKSEKKSQGSSTSDQSSKRSQKSMREKKKKK